MRNKKRLIIFLMILVIAAGGVGAYVWKEKIVNDMSGKVVANPDNMNPDLSTKDHNKIINVLLLGSDARGDEIGRTDSIMFVSLNTATKQVSMISIPRDTRVNLPGIGLTKITHANVIGNQEQGAQAIIQASSNLLGAPINNYIIMNFEGFRDIVDTVGGIDIDLPMAIDDYMQALKLPAGPNHLNGDQALRLARVRYSLPDGDFGRQWLQYRILSAISDKVFSMENITKLPQIIGLARNQLLDTNMTQAEMLALASKYNGFSSNDIAYYQIPGSSLTARDPLVGANVYYFEADKAELQNIVSKAIKENA